MKKLLIILCLVFMCGCSAVPSEISDSKVKETMKEMKYVQDPKTGICFAMVSSRVWYLGIFPRNQNGLGLTVVPCEACKDLLVE